MGSHIKFFHCNRSLQNGIPLHEVKQIDMNLAMHGNTIKIE